MTVTEEDKICINSDRSTMCFNTGLLNHHMVDIYAYFEVNKSTGKKSGQDWYLCGFKISTDNELKQFQTLPDIADLALAVDKEEHRYIGKTILPLEWAYTNSRRIVRPEVNWLKI